MRQATSPLSLSMINTRRSSLDFFTLTATVHRKVELFFIWAQVALCKLTTSADLTVVKTPNTKLYNCSFMAGMAQFSPFLLGIYTYMFFNSFYFVHRWNAQLTELTAQHTWLDLHKSSTTNHFTVSRLSSETFSI